MDRGLTCYSIHYAKLILLVAAGVCRIEVLCYRRYVHELPYGNLVCQLQNVSDHLQSVH